MRQLKSLSVFAAGLACGLLVHWMPESSVNAFNAPGSRAVAGEQQDAGRRTAGDGSASGRGSGCAADIAPLPGGDGVVDVNDLLAVISSWGPCSVGNLDADQDGWTVEDGDCDDTNPNVHPGAIEVCNGIDDDCDGEIDEDAVGCTIWYRDMDGDGYGDCSDYVCACQPTSAYTAFTCGDCDDTNPNVHPGAVELCNSIDDDCDGEIDEGAVDCTIWYRDMDGDGYGDCNDYVCACQPIAPYTTLTCGDCDDTDPYIHPAALEICNFIDDNCDGVIDENALDCMIWYRDMDRDGFGYCNDYVCACYPLPPYDASVCGDCDDTNPFMFPGAIEICNGIDDDCDGDIDEGC